MPSSATHTEIKTLLPITFYLNLNTAQFRTNFACTNVIGHRAWKLAVSNFEN